MYHRTLNLRGRHNARLFNYCRNVMRKLLEDGLSFQIFDGYSEDSGSLLSTNWTQVNEPINGSVTGHAFQVVVVLVTATGSDVSFNATYSALRK